MILAVLLLLNLIFYSLSVQCCLLFLQNEMTWVLERQGPSDSDAGSDGVLRCRGLPYGTSEAQVIEFFDGFEIAENGVSIPPDSMGR